MDNAIVIGPALSVGAVKEFRGAIGDILKANCDESTKHAALACLETGVRLKGGDYGTLSHCNVTVNDGKASTRKRPAKKARRK